MNHDDPHITMGRSTSQGLLYVRRCAHPCGYKLREIWELTPSPWPCSTSTTSTRPAGQCTTNYLRSQLEAPPIIQPSPFSSLLTALSPRRERCPCTYYRAYDRPWGTLRIKNAIDLQLRAERDAGKKWPVNFRSSCVPSTAVPPRFLKMA